MEKTNLNTVIKHQKKRIQQQCLLDTQKIGWKEGKNLRKDYKGREYILHRFNVGIITAIHSQTKNILL